MRLPMQRNFVAVGMARRRLILRTIGALEKIGERVVVCWESVLMVDPLSRRGAQRMSKL